MTKRESLVRDLAGLLARYSSDDWEYAIAQLQIVAQIAQELSRVPVKPRRIVAKGAKLKSKKLIESTRVAPSDAQIAKLMSTKIATSSASELRSIALYLGIKDDIPKNPAEAENIIRSVINKLPTSERGLKTTEIIKLLGGGSPSISDHYDRWFSLITKKP